MPQVMPQVILPTKISDQFVLRLCTPSGDLIEVGKAPWSYHSTENGMHALCAYIPELKTYRDKYGVVYEHTIYKLVFILNKWPLQQQQVFTLTQDPKFEMTK